MGPKRVTRQSVSEEQSDVAYGVPLTTPDSDSDGGGGFIKTEEPVKKRRTRNARVVIETPEEVSTTPADPDSDATVDIPMSSRQAQQLAVKRRRTTKQPKRAKRVVKDESGSESEGPDYVPSDSDGADKVESDDDLPVVADDDSDEDKESPSSGRAPRARARTARAPRGRARRRAADILDENGEVIPRHVLYFRKVQAGLEEHHEELRNVFDKLRDFKSIEPFEAPQPDDMVSKLLPFQREGLNWLQKQEASHFKGGILADEMGMGKTIQTVALFMTDPEGCGPRLVVAPTVALMQWKHEIDTHTGGKLKVHIYHGSNRSSDSAFLSQFDVILTTYAVIESVYRKQQSGFRRKNGIVKEPSALHTIEFHRIILDEAHNIKDRQSNTARAVFNMNAKYRLCLSGTPLQNRIGEVYSLLRFLGVEPFSKYFCTKCPCASHAWNFTTSSRCDLCNHVVMQHVNYFNHSLLKHIQRNGHAGPGAVAMQRMRLLMSKIMLRRTKLERADDLGLPPRVVEIRRDYFNEHEKDLYASVYSDSNRKFSTYVNDGVVLNNYANIFTLITRMRQIADHPDLVLRRHLGGNTDEANNQLVCKICDDEAEEAIQSRCHHTFCRLCIKEYVEGWTGDESELECPVCHVILTIDLTAPAIEVDQAVVKKGSIINRINMDGGWKSSTKIEALVEELYRLRSDRQTIKSIVFSQFTSMLDLVEWRLRRAGFQTVKLQGSMSPTQRDSIIKHFMETTSVEIFLVSLKAGGVALNLCEASQVFILDPWWNPSVEWQSGDRVHRIGQHRPVTITRLVIEDSIESRIIELQEKKARMIRATIGDDDAALNKLTPADMQFLFQN